MGCSECLIFLKIESENLAEIIFAYLVVCYTSASQPFLIPRPLTTFRNLNLWVLLDSVRKVLLK